MTTLRGILSGLFFFVVLLAVVTIGGCLALWSGPIIASYTNWPEPLCTGLSAVALVVLVCFMIMGVAAEQEYEEKKAEEE